MQSALFLRSKKSSPQCPFFKQENGGLHMQEMTKNSIVEISAYQILTTVSRATVISIASACFILDKAAGGIASSDELIYFKTGVSCLRKKCSIGIRIGFTYKMDILLPP